MEIPALRFLTIKKKNLNDFYNMWLKNSLESPETYPSKLTEAEWEEQLSIFEESVNEE